MRWRRQLPAYSPIPVAALAASLSSGDSRPALRASLKEAHDSADVVLMGSGTMALSLALRTAAHLRSGLPCVLPAYGCYDLATAAVGAGVTVRLYDVDPLSLAPDEASLRRALAGGASALVAVHHYGLPAPLDALRAAAEAAGAILIEDAAQGAGGTWQGRRLGSHGALGVLSFGRGKGLTGGGGGSLLINDPALVPLIDASGLRSPQGIPAVQSLKLVIQWALGRPALYRLPTAFPGLGIGETIYRTPEPESGISRASARVLRHTFQRVDAEAAHRGTVARRLQQALAVSTVFDRILVADPMQAGWLRLPAVARETAATISSRFSHLGVQSGYPRPLNELAEIGDRLEPTGAWPGAAHLARHLVTFPTHSLLSESDVRALERVLQGASDS